MIDKSAAIKTKLLPHQERALKRALLMNIILAHSTGSGKTLTSIAIADKLNKPTVVMTPASLVENYHKELQKHKQGGPPVTVMSLPTAVKHNYKVPEGSTLIVDEAHSLRNEGTQRQQYVQNQAKRAGRVVALSGTPAYNEASDWATLANVISHGKAFPGGASTFKERYIKDRTIHPSVFARIFSGAKPGVKPEAANLPELKRVLGKNVDVYEADKTNRPDRKDQDIYVEMSPLQEQTYREVASQIPRGLLWKLKNNLPPSKSEAKQLNSFYSAVRQVSNTPEAFVAGRTETGTKIKRAVEELRKRLKANKAFKAFVYSNYLESGVNSYSNELKKHDIPHAVFTGALTPTQKKEIVSHYNTGKVPVLLGTGSASEGLDLKGTRLIQILEPHFNRSRIEQAAGRGARFGSHSHLPEDQRNVEVQHFYSRLPEKSSWFGLVKSRDTSVDEYLKTRSDEKQAVMDDVRKALS